MLISGYRCMWVVVMFDLPVDTADARRQYARFRKSLIEDGFTMLQFSVYARHCASEENAEVHLRRVSAMVPPDGEVRVLTITDKQFERMAVYLGETRGQPEAPPPQLHLF